jgi:hypothetical protein
MGQAVADKPYLAAAFFCEKVLEQKDDVLTIVRIVDTFFVTIPDNLPLSPGVKPAIQIAGLLSFKKASLGTEGEKHEARMKLRLPSGRVHSLPAREFNFKPDELSGYNMILNIALGVEEYGLFWLEISVDDDEVMTRMPFRLLQAVSPPTLIH